MSRRSDSDDRADRALGMHQPISRRDLIQGMAVGAATTLSTPWLTAAAGTGSAEGAAQDRPGYYPPALTGLRGSHAGSFESAHALRDATSPPGDARDTHEHYDLVVVGAGISGLSAAHFFRAQVGPRARILVLDNHDDFGGHAKRNEFVLDGRLHLMNGGTLLIDSPRPYGPIAAGLVRDLGIDVEKLAKTGWNPAFYRDMGLGSGTFFDRETFGADKLVTRVESRPLAEWLAETPLSAQARADIERIEGGAIDFMPGLTSDEKKDRLSRISYAAFLRDVVGADPAAVRFYQARPHGEWGVGADAISALDCWGIGLPGFEGMKLEPGSTARMGFTPAGYADTGGSTRFHFPDGNASIARLLVRSLIPAAVPGHSASDVVTARVNYARLDAAPSPVRLRLSSTVVRVAHDGDPGTAGAVDVTYVRDGRTYQVHGARCVLASWNMMIPYLCPELPEQQKSALHGLVKTPLVYTSVALRDWQAFARLKVSTIYSPGSYFVYQLLNWHSTIGGYVGPKRPEEPNLVHMVRTPCSPGLSEADQHRAGRAELLATPFETYEREIRSQLARMLGAGGFDPARDIRGITVNRWPHGYAPEYNPLWDPEVPEHERPWVRGRQRFGRIAIANSDAGGGAYTDVAMEQAHRAVTELLRM